MSRSMMKCGNCGTPTYRKKASFCEICGHSEIIPDENAITKPKTKTDKPTRKELEIQLKSLQTEKKRLEKIVTETIEKLNKKSVELDQLQRSTDPQALTDAQQKIIELEYSNYLLGEELACIKIDLSDAGKISSEALDRYQKLLAEHQQDIVEFNFFMDLLVEDLACVRKESSDAEEQALEVFDKYQKMIESQSKNNEEEKGGKPSMMKPEKKTRKSRKVKHPIATFIAIIIILIAAIAITIAIFATGNKQSTPGTTILTPTPHPTISSPLTRPTPTPKPTIKPTPQPVVSPQPTIKPIIPSKTPESTSKKRRILTGKGKSLPFQIGDTVVGWKITIDGGSIEGGIILYNSPIEGILTDGVINPESWDIYDQRVITLDDILKN